MHSQHPCLILTPSPGLGKITGFGLGLTGFFDEFFITSLVIAIKASETLVEFFAEVSKNFIPYCSANSFPCSTVTFLSFSISHLFPTNIL